MKGELEELGESVDDSFDSISKVQTQILNLTSGDGVGKGVNIFDSNNNFRDYYDIIKDISEVYDKMSSANQASLLEILFGKNRGNQGAALIQAFQSGQVQKAYDDAINSSGSAMKEQERLLDSIEAKTKQFEASWQSLSNTFLDSDLVRGVVDFGTGFVSFLDTIIDKIGSLSTIGLGAGLLAGIKNVGGAKLY